MIHVIIPAGGQGTRYSSSQSKLTDKINGKPIWLHAITPFLEMRYIEGITLAIPRQLDDECRPLMSGFSKVKIVPGGSSRAESVKQAFDALPPSCTHVLIHDAARPNVQASLIQKVIGALLDHDIVIPGCPLTDTIKVFNGIKVIKTIDRNALISVQTPQGFSYELLSRVYQQIDSIESFTDEAAMLESLGHFATIIHGESDNIKITYPKDLTLAKHYMTQRKKDRH